MSEKLLRDGRLFRLLYTADQDLAAKAHGSGCSLCGGPLHVANYRRKPRGGPEWLGVDQNKRFSFCCGAEGCRKRLTPPSLRFLGRKVYLGAVVVLVTAMQHGLNPARMRKPREVVGVSRRTVVRWREWWLSEFTSSRFWKGARGRLARPIDEAFLPRSLLDCFNGITRIRLVSLLEFVSPVTSFSAPGSMAF